MRRFSAACCCLLAVALRAPELTGQQPATARSIDRARLDRLLGTRDTTSLKVVRRTGIQDVQATAAMVSVIPGDIVFRKVDSVALRESGRSPASGTRTIFQLPYRWLTIDSDGIERLLISRLIVQGNGLTYDPTTRLFRGTAMIGVEDSLHPGDGPQALTHPVRMQLTLTGPGDVAPRTLSITHTSLDYDSISISARDSVAVRIVTATDRDGILVPVQVYRPTIALSALPTTLQAFGLGTTVISVALPPGFSRTDTLTVRFRSPTLNVRPALLRVTADGDNEAKIRSGTPGRHTIGGDVDGMQADSIDVRFVFPWVFVTAALVGMLIGGAATYFGREQGQQASVGTIIGSALVGFLFAVAAALGLDLQGLHLDDAGTWAGVMLAAALGTYPTKRFLERLPTGAAAPASP